ncbi:hypothetical protein FRC06_003380, partial [Ceratobasidium sp. 370]
KLCTTGNNAPASPASDSSLSLPPSPAPAPSHAANRNVATTPKGAQKKRNMPDTIEQPPLAKKQKVTTKEPLKETAAHMNPKVVANRSDSWSTSYHEEVASLPPPLAPKNTKKVPALPAPELSCANEPSNLSTSASLPHFRPKMRPPPPDSPPAPMATRAAKAELVELVEAGGSGANK